ncbi:hypothetical protein [Clostridium sp. DL1XJH146]
MENEFLLKAIENLLDKKIEPINQRLDKIDQRLDKFDQRLDKVEEIQKEIKVTQDTILNFITQADTEFMKLEEKTKDIDKIKKIINISNVK